MKDKELLTCGDCIHRDWEGCCLRGGYVDVKPPYVATNEEACDEFESNL